MNNVELTIEEAQELFKKSRATIYNWINAGRFGFRDTEKGRIIIMSADEVENIKNNFSGKSNSLDPQESKLDNVNLVSRMLDQNQELQSKLLEYNEKLLFYSEQAGQVKLLTDNSKFYQEEYFRIKHEYESNLDKLRKLELELETLKKLNTELAEENDKLKQNLENKSPWWKRKVL